MMRGPSFLQSPEWQSIQEAMGRPTRRIASVLLIEHELALGFRYLYAPRPADLSPYVFDSARAYAASRGAIFLKVDPSGPLPRLALRPRPSRALQPWTTLVVHCPRSDQELLAVMHPKTRYNIRLAERHGVEVRMVEANQEAIGTFWKLLAETADRDGFTLHPAEHYRALLQVASRDFKNLLVVAEHDGQTLGAAIVNLYAPSGTATYLHGGSSRHRRDVMASHLLHWRIIQLCRERGLASYDWGGVDDARWPGLTRFKQGFGGERVTFPPSADFAFRPFLYRLYRFYRTLRGVP